MDIKEIKQIIDLMKKSELTEFQIEEKELKLCLKRHVESCSPPVVAAPVQMPMSVPQAVISPAYPAASKPAEDEKDIAYIKSPMVGTFYRAPSPESPPFVEVGAKVSDETAVCILEAMKVMNEIQAETKGQIVEILVENAQTVEFGQPLFKVKVSG